MPHHDAHLLTLVKLLEGRLPVAVGVSVREKLASDAALFEHWRMLSSAIGSKTPLDDVDRLASVDLETVAAFADGRLNVDEAADFERSCWKNPDALREVVSLVRSFHTDVSSINVPRRFAQQSSSCESTVKRRPPSRSTIVTAALIGMLLFLAVFFVVCVHLPFSR